MEHEERERGDGVNVEGLWSIFVLSSVALSLSLTDLDAPHEDGHGPAFPIAIIAGGRVFVQLEGRVEAAKEKNVVRGVRAATTAQRCWATSFACARSPQPAPLTHAPCTPAPRHPCPRWRVGRAGRRWTRATGDERRAALVTAAREACTGAVSGQLLLPPPDGSNRWRGGYTRTHMLSRTTASRGNMCLRRGEKGKKKVRA